MKNKRIRRNHETDAEFLVDLLENGQLKVRTGQVWKCFPRKGETVLLLDLDECESFSQREIGWRLHLAGVKLKRIRHKPSPSGTGIHVAVFVEGKFNRYQVLALQAILESDPCREARNFRAAGQANRKWRDDWQVLFQ